MKGKLSSISQIHTIYTSSRTRHPQVVHHTHLTISQNVRCAQHCHMADKD